MCKKTDNIQMLDIDLDRLTINERAVHLYLMHKLFVKFAY